MKLYTTADAAANLGISIRRVQQLAASRELGTRVGRDILFAAADIEAMRERTPGRPVGITTARLGGTIIGSEDIITCKLVGGISAKLIRGEDRLWRLNGEGKGYEHLRDLRNTLRNRKQLHTYGALNPSQVIPKKIKRFSTD